MAQPLAKRVRMTVSVGGGGGERTVAAAVGVPVSPGSRRLRQTLFAVLFLVRMSVKNTVTPSFSQMSRMVKRHVDEAFQKCIDLFSSKFEGFQQQIEGKFEGFQQQIEGLHHEVKQLARLCSNRQADHQARPETNNEHGTANISNTNYRLRFLNGLKTPVYTEKNITAEDDAAIKIGIFEGDNMITTGPLSKQKLEVLVLRGDFSNDGRESWTEEVFSNHIVQGRDGRGFVLGGDCTVWLTNGEASLGRLRFKEGSSRTRSRMFIIGARVCKSEKTGVRVQEAVMKPVTVRDRRNEANEKRHPPKLDDEVYRLDEISKDGKYHKRLQKADIHTVHDFLKALNKDANKLREVLKINKQHNSWEKMVKHARECRLNDEHEHKVYQNANANTCADPSFAVPSGSQEDPPADPAAHQAVEELSHAQNGSFCANVNDDPCSSVPDYHNIQYYQDEGTLASGQGQYLWTTEVTGEYYFPPEDVNMTPFLNQSLPEFDQELERLHLSQSNDIATTSAHINIVPSPQQLPFGVAAGAPPLRNNASSEASASAPAQNPSDLSPQQMVSMPWKHPLGGWERLP